MKDGMLFDFCESCRIKTATCLLYFYDDGPTFSVCDQCAEVASGYYGKVVAGGDDAA